MREERSWYELLSKDELGLSQGDLLFDCIVPDASGHSELKPNLESKALIDVKRINVVVMTQVCQFAQNKAKNITICPFMPLKEFIAELRNQNVSNKKIKDVIDSAVKGHHATIIVLDCYNAPNQYDYKHDYLVLVLSDIHTISYQSALKIAQRQPVPRLRLRTPYREYVNRTFANQFSSIGLPVELDRQAISNLLKSELSNSVTKDDVDVK